MTNLGSQELSTTFWIAWNIAMDVGVAGEQGISDGVVEKLELESVD